MIETLYPTVIRFFEEKNYGYNNRFLSFENSTSRKDGFNFT